MRKTIPLAAALAAALLGPAALVLPAAPARAQAAAPDPAALDLARLLMSRDPSLYDDADLGRLRNRIQTDLLGADAPCNVRASECQGAAAEIAARYAPALRQHLHLRSEQLTAAALQRAIRPEEMARVAAWLRSAEGSHFLEAWAGLRDPDAVRQRRRALEGDLAESAPAIFNPARAELRQRSRNLPQPAPR